jgi:serine/threonine protein kinase
MKANFPADVWSLGCVFYEVISRKRPFGEDYITFIQNVINNDPYPIPSNCSQDLKNIIFQMLDKNPSTRITISQILQLPLILNHQQPNPIQDFIPLEENAFSDQFENNEI